MQAGSKEALREQIREASCIPEGDRREDLEGKCKSQKHGGKERNKGFIKVSQDAGDGEELINTSSIC